MKFWFRMRIIRPPRKKSTEKKYGESITDQKPISTREEEKREVRELLFTS